MSRRMTKPSPTSTRKPITKSAYRLKSLAHVRFHLRFSFRKNGAVQPEFYRSMRLRHWREMNNCGKSHRKNRTRTRPSTLQSVARVTLQGRSRDVSRFAYASPLLREQCTYMRTVALLWRCVRHVCGCAFLCASRSWAICYSEIVRESGQFSQLSRLEHYVMNISTTVNEVKCKVTKSN